MTSQKYVKMLVECQAEVDHLREYLETVPRNCWYANDFFAMAHLRQVLGAAVEITDVWQSQHETED